MSQKMELDPMFAKGIVFGILATLLLAAIFMGIAVLAQTFSTGDPDTIRAVIATSFFVSPLLGVLRLRAELKKSV